MDPEDLAALTALEESLWRPATRFDRGHLERVLAPDFTEFGQSGRIWTRSATIGVEPAPFESVLPLPGLRVTALGPDAALLTYRSETTHPDGRVLANRSSVWRRTAAGWQLVFHQGTPIPAARSGTG